ncbi:MAG: hypothetical protein IPK82_32965 [Polyangiaceae bacterium]|nr:hypothetical protein [Polyangiaceae bacterium]
MSPLLSWIDRNEVSALLARVSRPLEKQPEIVRQPPKVIVAAEPPPVPASVRTPPASVASVPSSSPAVLKTLGVVAQQVDLPELILPEGSVYDRSRVLCEWIDKSLKATSVFLADENGLLIHGLRADTEYAVVMAPLLATMQQVGSILGGAPSRGAVTVRDSEVLHWAETSTIRGRFCVGVLLSSSLDDRILARLQRELTLALEEKNND